MSQLMSVEVTPSPLNCDPDSQPIHEVRDEVEPHGGRRRECQRGFLKTAYEENLA
jgi:hypothetical protein